MTTALLGARDNPIPGKALIASFDATSSDTTKAPRFFPAALPTGDSGPLAARVIMVNRQSTIGNRAG